MPTPPNVLILLTDEQRADTLACGGGDADLMPGLNRWAERATCFTQAYCTQPVCTPSRASIFTGLYPHATGATGNNRPLDAQVRCLPELLPAEARQRYATGYIGKWHLGDEIFAQHGFDHWIGTEDHYNHHYGPGRDKTILSPYAHWLLEHGFKPDCDHGFTRGRCTSLPEPFGKPAYAADQACRFIREHRDNPFILTVSLLEPHMPFFGPRTAAYESGDVAMPATFDIDPGPESPMRVRLKSQRFQRGGFEWYDLSGDAGWKRMMAAYLGLCNLVDHHFNRVLSELQTQGLEENTIVVMLSDHGEMMGARRMLGKSVMYRDAMQVPLVIRAPGQRTGSTVEGPVSLVDLVPTLLEMMDMPAVDGLHGQSLAGAVTGGPLAPRDVHVHWNELERPPKADPSPWMVELAGSPQALHQAEQDRIRTIITPDGWLLTISVPCGDHELFHLASDPHQRSNLIRKPEHQPLITELAERIRQHQHQTADPHPLPTMLPPPRIGDA